MILFPHPQIHTWDIRLLLSLLFIKMSSLHTKEKKSKKNEKENLTSNHNKSLQCSTYVLHISLAWWNATFFALSCDVTQIDTRVLHTYEKRSMFNTISIIILQSLRIVAFARIILILFFSFRMQSLEIKPRLLYTHLSSPVISSSSSSSSSLLSFGDSKLSIDNNSRFSCIHTVLQVEFNRRIGNE